MSKEFEALVALRDYLRAYLDPAPQPALADGQVVVEYPDVDSMPYATMVYIVPEREDVEQSSMTMSQVTLAITMYVILKNQQMATMIQAAFDYLAAIQNAINKDRTLGGSLAECEINAAEFYPAIVGLTNSVGIEITGTITYERTTIYYPDDNMMPDEGLVPIGG